MQQLTQGHRPGLVQGRPQGRLRSFQIQPPVLVLVLPDDLEQTAYFVRDFLLDRFGRFFSCGVKVASRGRSRQILSLTAISS